MQSRQTTTRSAARGTRGAVAAAREHSANAAAQILEAGGNAVDAGVAAALVAGVIEPMETTLAGSGLMLIGATGDASVTSVDFGPRAPAAARSDMYRIDAARNIDRGLGISVVLDDANVQGISSMGVPATFRGLFDAHARFGRLAVGRVVAPAVQHAYDGFDADSYYALEALANIAALRADSTATERFLVDGLPPAAAHLGTASLGVATKIRQPALGRTLEVIAAHGVEAFYSGELATSLLATVRELGGLLDAPDLASCKARIAPARRLRYRDVDVWAPNAPCGALTELQMLQIWLALHPAKAPQEDTSERIRHLAEVGWHAFADRYHWLGDPDFVPVPETGLLSPAYAESIANAIRANEAPPRSGAADAAPWNHFASRAAHDPWPLEEGGGQRRKAWNPGGATEPTAGTTHISVIDGDGMAVSITHTAANHFGAKVVCPRTGLLLDAAMGWFNALPNAANSIAGGKRPLANMGPIVITHNGIPQAAIGAPGGRRIISAVMQVALNLVERGMSADAALLAPRIDASGSGLLASERIGDAGLGNLKPLVQVVREQHEAFGYELARPIIAVRESSGETVAAADPFSRGAAVAL